MQNSSNNIQHSYTRMNKATFPAYLTKSIVREQNSQQNEFRQQPYRWVIIVLAACAMIINGLLNNIIIPIAHKLSVLYGQSTKVVNLATILSFLIFSFINIPINYFLDKRGIKIGYRIGLSLYLTGMFFVCLVNVSFPLVIFGYIIFTFGQPFILNTPAKIATYWFFPQNRALATTILVGSGIIGSGLGFAIPTLTVKEDSQGELAQRQVFSLYMGYGLATAVLLIINMGFLKQKPKISPSNIVQKEQLSFKQTFQLIKNDSNIWKFYICYFLVYGSFQTFASSANLLIKPFGATDFEISLAAICLILLGTVGAIISSIILKKYRCYKLIFRTCCVGALVCIILLAVQLVTIDSVSLIKLNVGMLGFFLTPIIPTCYELGCQIAFPIGEAQVTGLLNGSSLIWAFISDSLLTLIIGFGSQKQTMIFIIVLIIFISIGNVLCFTIKIDLKRKAFQQKPSQTSTRESQSTKNTKAIQMISNLEEENYSNYLPKNSQYKNLNEQQL